MKDRKTVPDIIDLLKSGDEKTQQVAATALVAITGKSFEKNSYDAWHGWWVKEGSKH